MPSSLNGAGKTECPDAEKNKLNLHTLYRNCFHVDQKPQFETQNTKTARRKHLHNLGVGNGLINWTSFAQELRITIDRWDLIKLKSCCTAKETTK